jgi:CheY-like chemotaxis protein
MRHLETAGSGWDVMERLQTGRFLICSCSNYPGVVATVVLRWLRRLRPDLPIILISQTDDRIDPADAQQAAAPDSLKSLQNVKLEAETNAIVATLQKTG